MLDIPPCPQLPQPRGFPCQVSLVRHQHIPCYPSELGLDPLGIVFHLDSWSVSIH